ncbi:nitrate reductase [Actibacterium sp. 188UL27-1]|uniref:nitrate reductase n=1 Tax=Actibacterium sp. 188UL27-1 TaxID=2786961 RepID=UPI001959F58C|nr:nitrate reductase [Actibacterium sp. 188UL27-1]MBM7068880.1 molybdopterin-dependent oxidoreductase [Actibacterium sp. 188UL27-1]
MTQTKTQVRTTCPYCGVGCGVLAGADGSIAGDPDHPANLGRLCSKGAALGETLDLEGRLLHPQIDGARADWDTALDLVASKFKAAIAEHGPDSVAFYGSGQLLTEDYYVANKLMKGFIGSANIDTNSRLCMASSVAGHKRAFGTDTVPGTYEDLEQADLVVLVGSNLAWCHPVLYQRIAAAKQTRPAMKVVVIDPRRTATCDLADLHLAIRPDGDVALFNNLLCHLNQQGKINPNYIDAHVDGIDAALETAEMTNDNAGLSSHDIQHFLNLWAETERVVTVYSQGVNQSASGTDKVNAILNCHLATGRIGRPGMGPFSVTGQPNAMGGREVGGLANMLGWHLDLENAAHRDAVQQGWQSPTIATKPGLKAVDLFQACADGKIKALWILSTNPAVSMPDARAVAEAIRAVPFTVVSDIMARTDTGDLADVLLPAAGWGEKSGTVTNSERRISRQRAFLPTPSEARPDWRIISDVAGRMGWADAFTYHGPDDVFREYADLSALAVQFGRDLDLTGLADLDQAAYDALPPVQWPVPKDKQPGGRFFADGGFYTNNGKAQMLPVVAPVVAQNTDFHLNTGRVRDQWHTMTRTARAPRLNAHMAEPYLEIHPEDAVALGLRHADLARITAEGGQAILRVLISTAIQPGHVFAPMHWTAQTAPAGRSNPMIDAITDPVSGQPALKAGRVEIAKFEARWFAFVASATRPNISRPYAAIARTETGWRAEVAGVKAVGNWEVEARCLTGLTDGTASVVADPATGTARIAIVQDGHITGLVFAASTPVAAARAHIVTLVGTDTSTLVALAGRPGADTPDPGAIVCSCFGVGINTLRAEIASGARTVAKLGERTCAGTNCGSCKPELAALLTARQPMAAE